MNPKEISIKIGKYTFKIIENKLEYGGNIFSYTLKIGGDYIDCVNLSYMYNNGKPISAKLPHLMYEPECAVGSNLDKGIGSVTIIKALLRYGHSQINSINIFNFDDMSHIDCVEKNLSNPPPRKPKRPLKLSYLSIAYNDMTWYEKYFNATMTDKDKYTKYRSTLKFLTTKTEKVPFGRFLEIANPPVDQLVLLERYYKTTDTYRDFFNAIPYRDRCEILISWLENFMTYYLKGVYSDSGWEIDINTMEQKKGGSKNRRTTRKLYPSNYKVINYQDIHSF